MTNLFGTKRPTFSIISSFFWRPEVLDLSPLSGFFRRARSFRNRPFQPFTGDAIYSLRRTLDCETIIGARNLTPLSPNVKYTCVWTDITLPIFSRPVYPGS